jgi:NADH-quinone oxidoreductase subunit H
MGLDFPQILAFLDNEFAVQLIATAIKFAVIFAICVQVPPIMIWVERRAPALMQRRKGPNRVGIYKFRLWGLLQSAADAVKLILKEEIVPRGANKIFFQIAPIFGVIPALLVACAIPYGNNFQLFGYNIPLSIVNVDVGFLFILAISSLGVYGVTIAGWASNNKYSLLGSLRASAQMISYEIPLGMSLIPIVLIYGTLDLNQIVIGQSHIWNWGIITSPVSFLIFFVCMFAETNRAPFDLAESEGELVAGFHTEYGSAKFALIFLTEYVVMFVLSCLASTVFFGGWQIPFVPYETLLELVGGHSIVASLIGTAVLFIKAGFFMWMYVWVRWTLPRFRYDQLMSLGWKFMLPVGLANVFITAIIVAILNFK